MSGCLVGDLVQYSKEQVTTTTSTTTTVVTENSSKSVESCLSGLYTSRTASIIAKLDIHRVGLEDPPINHLKQIQQVLLPRLYEYVQCVYEFRHDQQRRKEWLKGKVLVKHNNATFQNYFLFEGNFVEI